MSIITPTPAEKPEDAKSRRNVIFSFWAVILLLGVPTWWKTTSIPRAALPFTEMLKWENKYYSHIVNVRISTSGVPCDYARRIVTEVQDSLDAKNEFEAFRIRTQLVHFLPGKDTVGSSGRKNECNLPEVEIGDPASALDITLKEGDNFKLDTFSETTPIVGIFARKDVQTLGTTLAEELRQLFADEQAAVANQYLNRDRSNPTMQDPISQAFIQTLSPDIVQKIRHDAMRALKPWPMYHLTFSLFTAGGSPSSWDIEPVLKSYVQPLIHSFASTVKVSVTTQVQMYSAFSSSVQPFNQSDGSGWLLREHDLTAFINTAEWPLSPSIGFGPTINFILYVPDKAQLPLQIENGKGSSWIIPQWGGISILNPPLVTNPDTQGQDIVQHLDATCLQPAFETFRAQLLTLMGVPNTPRLPLELRLKSFQRLAGLSLYLRTSSNLGALARLADRLSNIPIPHHVLDLVDNAGFGLFKFESDRSLLHALVAYAASEKAFFDKSMVGQVYFPDEHKIAVYLPLLGPIGVPLVVALLREIKLIMGRK